jgi:isoleucyl-tRNA synthetase
LRALEAARVAKLIGSSLEAHVRVRAKTRRDYDLLESRREQLRYLFIVSEVSLTFADEAATAGGDAVEVEVLRAEGQKCERCWNYSKRVGEFTRYPTVCERCIEALAEIEAEGSAA